MGQVVIERKPEQKPISAEMIATLKTYRVVKYEAPHYEREAEPQVKVDDIVVAIPGPYHARYLLNATTGRMVASRSDLSPHIFCVRDFSVKSVMLAFDENEMPA